MVSLAPLGVISDHRAKSKFLALPGVAKKVGRKKSNEEGRPALYPAAPLSISSTARFPQVLQEIVWPPNQQHKS